MENIGDNVDKAEKYLADYIKSKFSFLNLGDPIIMPKKDNADREFIGLMLTRTTPRDLDGMILDYDIVIRVGLHRETLFSDRNKTIDIYRDFEDDTENDREGGNPQPDIFDIERSEEMTFTIDDDFFDMVFTVSITI